DAVAAAPHLEVGHGVTRGAGGVDAVAVEADRHRRGAVAARHATHPVSLLLDERQPPGGGVALEHRERTVHAARAVDVRYVQAYRDGARTRQARDAVGPFALRLDERELPRRRVAAEDGDRVVEGAGSVDVGTVGADGHRLRPEEALDAAGAAALLLHEGQHPAGDVALEDRDRVVVASGDVDVAAIGTDAHGLSP